MRNACKVREQDIFYTHLMIGSNQIYFKFLKPATYLFGLIPRNVRAHSYNKHIYTYTFSRSNYCYVWEVLVI